MSATAYRHGGARWASDEAYLRRTCGEGAYVGHWRGRVVRYAGDGPWSIIGGSGSGKFTTLLSRLVYGLCWRQAPNMVVLDPKGELASVLKAPLEAAGCEVRCINPDGLFHQRLGQDRLHPWDHLSATSLNYDSDVEQMVETFSNHGVSTQNPFFDETARDIVRMLMCWHIERHGRPPTLAELHTLINTIEGNPPLFALIAENMVKSHMPDVVRVARSIVARQKSNQRSLGDVLQTLYNLTAFTGDRALIRATEKPNCSLDELFDPGKRKVFFVIIPIGKLATWKPFYRGIFESLLLRAERTIAMPHRARPWVVVDEAAQINGPLLRLFYSAGRAFVNVVAAWQATWQMGSPQEMAEMMTSSSLITLEGGGLNDLETTKYFSELLGLQDVGDRERQRDRAHAARQALWDFMMYDVPASATLSRVAHELQQSRHQEHHQRPLAPPHALREMRQTRIALFASEAPKRLDKVPYWLGGDMPPLSSNPYAPGH